MSAPAGRLASLDVFRGVTIASMILVNNPGTWSAVYPPLRHADWHGWTFTDTVFPFFLWIVGVAMTFSMAKRVERGDNRGRLVLHTLRRAAIIFFVGLFMNGFPTFNLATIRIPGVLQRIAVCYLAATLIFLFTRIRGQIIALVSLLAVYWGFMLYYPVPGYGPGVLDKIGNFSQWIDNMLLAGHMYSASKVWDPEGVFSTLPAIATVLFGVLTGHLMRAPLSPARRVQVLVGGGAALFLLAQLMSLWMPVNKPIWTSSYAVLMAGLAMFWFGFWYLVCDVAGWRKWTRPFEIYGMNAIAVYVLSGLIAKIMLRTQMPSTDGGFTTLYNWIYKFVFLPLASPVNASLLFALSIVTFLYLVAWAMYRRGWFVRV